ncbi:MAG: hypothetical protein Q4A66_10355 [Eubacteriales bacterium]|nr:hypothetical protein [Eubacteriales bacterium]
MSKNDDTTALRALLTSGVCISPAAARFWMRTKAFSDAIDDYAAADVPITNEAVFRLMIDVYNQMAVRCKMDDNAHWFDFATARRSINKIRSAISGR